MKLGNLLVHIDKYNFTNFHWIQMKNKKVFLMTYLTDGPFVKGQVNSAIEGKTQLLILYYISKS